MAYIKAPLTDGPQAERVIEHATQEFFTKGLKSVTMDDIAHGLQMSKRTLYQLFADKETLIISCIKHLAAEERKLISTLLEHNNNVLEIVLYIIENRTRLIERVSPLFITDIPRYKALTDYLNDARDESIKLSAEFLKLGTQQGVFRNDVNFNILLHCIMARMDRNGAFELAGKYGTHEYFINIGLFHLRGCCTVKGIELVDAFLERYRKEHCI